MEKEQTHALSLARAREAGLGADSARARAHLDALECDLKRKGVGECGRVVQHEHVRHAHERHG